MTEQMEQRFKRLVSLMTQTDWEVSTSIENEDFILSQFPGTAFGSSYKCVKVKTKGNVLETDDGVFPHIFVAKITREKERSTMLELRHRGIDVPKVYGAMHRADVTVLFEEFIDGHELYNDNNVLHWEKTARILARVNSIDSPFQSIEFGERIRAAIHKCQNEPELKKASDYALLRLKKAPVALIHGDMLPTNIMVRDGNRIIFIDWGSTGVGPYTADLGRLTGVIDLETLQPFCPCGEAVRDTYYEEIKDKRGYVEYLQDFYAGQFMETAYCYDPEMLYSNYTLNKSKEYAKSVRSRLKDIMRCFTY